MIKEAIEKVSKKVDLSSGEMTSVFEEIILQHCIVTAYAARGTFSRLYRSF